MSNKVEDYTKLISHHLAVSILEQNSHDGYGSGSGPEKFIS